MSSEKPIRFQGAMIRALLNGSKTQDRQVVKPQPFITELGDENGTLAPYWVVDTPAMTLPVSRLSAWPVGDEPFVRLGTYEVGMRLRVRETWQVWTEFNNVPANDLPPEARTHINYPADGNLWDARQRPSIFMPRWASRITLEICEVRVERLNEITTRDAEAEGVNCFDYPGSRQGDETQFQACYRMLWNSTNGAKYPFESNPWVFAITFRRLEMARAPAPQPMRRR